jgi:hypothetical protein
MAHADKNLALAIKVNTPEQADKALAEFVVGVAKALKESKQEKRPLFVLPNWKFKSEVTAIEFSALAVSVLEKTTKEKFHICRMETGHEGHLMLGLGCGMPEDEFSKFVNGFDECKTCDKCGKESTLHKCGGCGTKYYCGKDCQKADWKNHKEACKKKSDVYKSVGIAVA